jgi:penicillin-binding protein-related factor A (putative recombinase)
MQMAGISDLIGVYNGRFVAIEIKTKANKKGATPIQEWFIGQVIKAGGVAFVARDLETVQEQINKIRGTGDECETSCV